MEEDRWPRRCLKQVARGIINRNPPRWRRTLEKALNKVGDGSTIPQIWEKLEKHECKDTGRSGNTTELEEGRSIRILPGVQKLERTSTGRKIVEKQKTPRHD